MKTAQQTFRAILHRTPLLSALLAFLCLHTLVAAEGSTADQQSEKEYYSFGTRFYLYDTEGRAGLISENIPFVNQTDVGGMYVFEDGQKANFGGGFGYEEPTTAPDIPFWWEVSSPWTGKVMGWGRSAQLNRGQFYLMPVPASELNLELYAAGELFHIMDLFIFSSLVDTLESPSPLIPNFMSRSGRTSLLTSVYLPGNALSQTVGLESHFFDEKDLAADAPACMWGQDTGVNFPYIARFSESIPYGPVLLALTFDGYTTAMTEVIGRDQTYYEIHQPFMPLPGSGQPNATQFLNAGDPPPWIMNATYEAALLGDSVDLTTDLDAICDRNDDGILNAADRFLYATQ